MFHRISVLLDHLAPQRGAFSLALDWARRFQIPLRGIAGPLIEQYFADMRHSTIADEKGSASHSFIPMQPHDGTLESLTRMASSLCADFKVPWEVSPWRGTAVTEFLAKAEPGELFVLGQSLTQAERNHVLQEATQYGGPALVFCSPIWVPPARILVIDHGDELNEDYLSAAAGICHSLRSNPIVLTIARSENTALRRQQIAQKVLAGFGLNVACDFIAGNRASANAMNVARWRRCQLAIVQRHIDPPWWHRFRDSTMDCLIELAESLPVLAFSETTLQALKSNSSDAAVKRPFISRLIAM